LTRPSVAVRDADPEDLPALMEMWRELREVGGRIDRATPAASEEGARERLRAITADPGSRVLVAVLDREVAGFTVVTRAAYAPLFDASAVHVHYLHVREGVRRRGVGKALLAAATTYAEEVGAEHMLTSVLPQLRETNRFYARLGFSPLVVRRSVPVSVLRRRLSAEGVPGPPDNLLVRRRTLRRVRAAMARVGD
jgi:GNAT superfamily N-acetyltransferase